jgi:hypothetical protein
MSSNNLRMAGIVALFIAIGAAVALIQREASRELREENFAQGAQLAQLKAQGLDLSNRLFQATATAPQAKDPPGELLRLRGEVGILRRQLRELQELTAANSAGAPQRPVPSSALSAETLRRLEDLQLRGKEVYARSKSLADQLQEKASNGESLLQAILDNGLQDNLLSSLLEERQLAAQKLSALQKDPGGQEPQLEDLSKQVTLLKEKAENRSKGILLGLDARVQAMKHVLDNLHGNSSDTTEDSLSGLEHLLKEADITLGTPR